MNCDLFGATLGSDVLSARQLRAATVAGKADEILGYERHRTSRALLPGRVGCRVDDYLTNDAPTRVVRIAACYEKPGERLRHPQRFRFGPMTVEVPKCCTYAMAAVDSPGELARTPPRLLSFIVDPPTVLVRGSQSLDPGWGKLVLWTRSP